ncbi:hypothetical protein O6H91_11G048000 [Diphasiastrum complanatum]|uniref:Uncharacterized protein n=1 Tax=Diphasiastrum complanatum TaxID=34168 RepID=A0ACC2C9X4_DIPCM|nr:hypothetical protein O6H91_11G048000 [Diphasiastrum complanatum]
MAWKELKVAVPSYFKCPISLDLMRDPVNVCTGMTYDRSNIERWLDDGHNTCPATMQVLQNQDLIPNHTLRRLIQSWGVANKSMGVERIPTPRQPLDRHQVQVLLKEAIRNDLMRLDTLKKLREKAKESLRNRNCMVEAGAVAVLSSILASSPMEAKDMEVCEEALGTLSMLSMDDSAKRMVAGAKQLSCLSWVLSKGSLDARINASTLLEDLASIHELSRAVGCTAGVIEALVELLQEDLNQMAVKIALRALCAIATSRRHCRGIVEAGAVGILVELLPSVEKSAAEHVLVILETLCKCAEGRAAVAEHALAIPAITKRMSRVSDAAAESAIGTLWAVCSFCADETTVHERAVEAGLFAKLILLLQMEFSASTKYKIADILRLLRNVCNDHPNKCNFDDARSVVM